jgi:two-component system response regulator ArlR
MRVLVVEDEIGIANFLQQGLEEEGYRVSVCNNGREGLKLALEEEFAILLLDWNLPEYSGLQICESIREKGINSPVIFLTARDTSEDIIKGLQAGANDYIKKPFNFNELLERMKVQLRGKEAPKRLVLGALEVLPGSRQAFVNGVEIHLTQKEFELLSYLLEQKGEVCPRSKIIEDVWDIHFDYETGVIDVYINALRKKLGEAAGLLKTVRGVGYMIQK